MTPSRHPRATGTAKGARSNPTYFDGDLRRALLDAAAKAMATRGAAGVSLRELARELGVSHAAPAHHFRDKSGLFTALAVEGFDRLTESMHRRASRFGEDSAAEQLVQTGVGYVGFAVRHRGHFEVMFRPDLLDATDADLSRAAAAAAAVLSDHVIAAQAAGWAAHIDSATIVTAAWALVHGLAALATQGALGELKAASAEHLTETVATLVARGIGALGEG